MFKKVCLLLILTVFAVQAQAQQIKYAPLTESQKQTVTAVEKYFNGVRSIKSDFYQVSQNGAAAEGTFLMKKPNKMRLKYTTQPVEIVADGYYLIFHDKKLEQVTYLDLDDNPASLIMKDSLSFDKEHLTVENVEHENGLISLTVFRQDQPHAGKITLVFKDKPLTLKQWRVTDAQGITTLVTLNNTEFNSPVDDASFKFKDPYRKRPGDM